MRRSTARVVKYQGHHLLVRLFLLTIMLGACVTVLDQQTLGAEARWEYTIREGSRTGNRASHLTHRGRTVGSYYSVMVIEGRQFLFNLRTGSGELLGYLLSDKERELPAPSGPNLTEEEIDGDWYLAAYQEQRLGTPAHWIWVERENLTAWADPLALTRLAARYGIAPILGDHEAGTRVSVGIGVSTSIRF